MVDFSVVIPTYNRAGALHRCLTSLVEQEYKNFEVIVCDDGSTDNTREVVESFQRTLNVKFDYAENWGGPAKPRNRGINLSSGLYVCFLDSDDWWKPNKLLVIKNNISEKYSVYYHTLMITNSTNELRKIRCRKIDNNNPKIDLLVNLNTLPTSSVCIASALLKKTSGFSLDKEIVGLEDYKFWIVLGEMGGQFKLIDRCLGHYFIGDNDSITFEDQRQIKRFEKLYGQYIADPDLHKSRNKIVGSLNFHIGRIIQDAKLNNKYIRHLFKAFLLGSLRVKLMALKRILRFQ